MPCDALIEEIRARAGDAFVLECDPAIEEGGRPTQRRCSGPGSSSSVRPGSAASNRKRSWSSTSRGISTRSWRASGRNGATTCASPRRRASKSARAGRDDLPAFHDLSSKRRVAIASPSADGTYFEALFDNLEPAGIMAMFLARLEGTPIAAPLHGRARLDLHLRSVVEREPQRHAQPPDPMDAIQWASEHGRRIYDFRGVSERARTPASNASRRASAPRGRRTPASSTCRSEPCTRMGLLALDGMTAITAARGGAGGRRPRGPDQRARRTAWVEVSRDALRRNLSAVETHAGVGLRGREGERVRPRPRRGGATFAGPERDARR